MILVLCSNAQLYGSSLKRFTTLLCPGRRFFSERRTLMFTVLSKLFPCALSPDVCMSYNYGSCWSRNADETFWVLVMCSCPFVLCVFANTAGFCSVLCSALSWTISAVLFASCIYSMSLPVGGRARAIRSLILAVVMMWGAQDTTVCAPVPETSVTEPTTTTIDNNTSMVPPRYVRSWNDVNDDRPLSIPNLPVQHVAHYTSLQQHVCTVKAYPGNQANCTVVNSLEHLIDPTPLRMTASTASESPAVATYSLWFGSPWYS